MRNKDVRLSFRPSLKNQVYLQRLGFLDARTGRLRKDGLDFSNFLNEVLTVFCEADKIGRVEIVSSDDLREAWRKFQLMKKIKEVDELNKEINTLVNSRLELRN